MKVVLLTNADSIFCKEYVEYVLLGKFEILIVSPNNRQYRQYYKENGIKVLHYLDSEMLAKRLEGQICSNDIFHVHYVDGRVLKKLWKPWLMCKIRILSYWGSDLLRVQPKQILSTLPFLYSADNITVINKSMRQKLKKYVIRTKWRHIKCLDFGNSAFDKIDVASVLMSVEKSKKYFELNPKKTIIFVGYNANREQQHLEMMREAAKLPKELIEEVFFVFHFGYGAVNNNYIKQLEAFLCGNDIPYKILTQFMNKDDIAVLRLCADIFLYGQTTDALSSSVMEYLYAGAVLVKPAWLDYLQLREKGIKYYEYEQFDEIPKLLEEIIKRETGRTNKGEKEQRILRNLSSWDRLAPKWLALYKEEPDDKRRKIHMAKGRYRKSL